MIVPSRRALGRLAAVALGAALLASGRPASAFDVGPAIGTKAPPITATTAGGAPATLAGVSGPKGVVLVFFRSAKWCPFCQAQLISLRDAAKPLADRGFKIAALSYDAPDVQANFARQRDIPFAFLSDQASVTVDAFGLRDPDYKPGHFAYGVPRPSIFVIASDGTIVGKLAEEGFKTRPTNEAVLDAVDHLPL